MSTATVSVRGYAIVPGQPDEARIGLTVSSRRPTPEEALDDVGGDSHELERILDELGIEPHRRRTTGASVSAESQYDGDAKRHVHMGYRATNEVVVTLSTADVIGQLLQEVTARVGAQVRGPDWRLALDNPAFVEAAAQAAEDARRKAVAYATALGARLGTVERVSEPHAATRHWAGQEDFSMVAQAVPEGPIDIHEGTLDVVGAVEVTFNLDQ